jgi:hypothetical protein
MQQIKATQNKDGTYKVKILDYNLNDEKVTMVIPRAQVGITAYHSLDPEGELYTIEVENERENTSINPDFCGAPCGLMRQIIEDQRAQIESLKKRVEELEDREADLEANDYY